MRRLVSILLYFFGNIFILVIGMTGYTKVAETEIPLDIYLIITGIFTILALTSLVLGAWISTSKNWKRELGTTLIVGMLIIMLFILEAYCAQQSPQIMAGHTPIPFSLNGFIALLGYVIAIGLAGCWLIIKSKKKELL